jgi:hypothetical protein
MGMRWREEGGMLVEKKTKKHRKRIKREDPAFWLHPHPPDCSNSLLHLIHRGKKEVSVVTVLTDGRSQLQI